MNSPKLYRLLAVLLAFTVTANSYVGKWHSFTNKERVTSLIAHQGYVYAGTQGGIRRVDPGSLVEKDYDNLDGLLDCWITGFSENADGSLWAVSKSGYVYKLSGDRWETFGRSYAAEQWVMNDRAVLSVGHYLLLGSQLGLTFFDVTRKISQANVTRFGDLTGIPVLSLLRRADTLYVGTSQGVYKAGIDLTDPVNPAQGSGYHNLLDSHGAWRRVALGDTGSGAISLQYDFMTFIGDSLKTFGPGMMLQTPIHVEAFAGHFPVIGDTVYSKVPNLTSALAFDSKVFLGGSSGMYFSSNPAAHGPVLHAIPRPTKFPMDTIANVSVLQSNLWGQSTSGVYHLNPNTGDSIFFSALFVDGAGNPVSGPEIMTRHLRNLRLTDNNDVYVGTWGLGLMRIRNGQKKIWNKQTNSCMVEAVENFPVVHALGNMRGKGLFFAMFKSEDSPDHQLIYLNTDNDQAVCMDSPAPGGHVHAIRMFSDSLLGVGSDLGVALYKVRDRSPAPSLSYRGLWTTSGAANETWSLSEDNLGRPWALIGNNLAYAEPDSIDTLFSINAMKLKTVDGFSGTDCFSLESDPLHSFWVGCGNGLFHIEPGPSGIARLERFGLDDGLLSLNIHDISVDPSNGKVWIATDRGINMLESSSQPPVTTLQTVQVYPNPFRPQHRFVIFDNLPKSSTVRIHNAAGAVVRTFHPDNLAGNQAQWDGTNEDGRPVSAGIYLYSVTAGSSVERGKIIVAR